MRSLLLLLLPALVLIGCGKSHDVNGFPVSGKVYYQGKPLAGVRVTFHKVNESDADRNMMKPTADTNEDGSFQMATLKPGDGVLPGEYVITFIALKSPGNSKADAGEDDERSRVKDFFGKKYAFKEKSTHRCTVKEGENVLPTFNLD